VQTLSISKESHQDYKRYLFVFLTALGARIFFLIGIDEPTLFFKYPFFAQKLAEGADIGERLGDLSPFYLYFLTLLKKAFSTDWTFVKLIQSFLGALNCVLVFVVGARAFRKEVGFLAGLMCALYGNLIILESTLEPTAFVLVFNLLSVYFLLRVQEVLYFPGARSWVLPGMAGVFVGLSIITKPNFLLFVPLAVVWLLFFTRKTVAFQKKLSCALLFCGAALLVVMPVTARNYVKLKDFVLVTADAGKVFYHGNGKGATALEGTGLPDEGFAEEGASEPDYAHVLFRKAAAKMSGEQLSPSESSRFWLRRALGDIVSDPVSYVKLEAKKLFYFFNDYEMHYIASAYKEYKASLSFPFIRYGIIASLGLLGMVLAIRHFREFFLVYGMVGVYLLSCMLFLSQSRYRTPVVPYLCLFAGYGMYMVKEMVVERRFRSAGVAISLVGVSFFLTTFFCRGEIVNVDQWQQATKIHYQMGAQPLFEKEKYQDAISELNKCLAIVPDFSPGYNLRGKSLAVLGKHEEALVDFKKVMSLSPGLPEGYKNTGFLYLLQGDKGMAESYLVKAVALAPQDAKAKDALTELRGQLPSVP
jgi:tetratricopeptide (TPR) repeat protein